MLNVLHKCSTEGLHGLSRDSFAYIVQK